MGQFCIKCGNRIMEPSNYCMKCGTQIYDSTNDDQKRNSMINKDIRKKYNDVRSSLENAIKSSDGIELSGEEENYELDNIRKTLNTLNENFKNEIEELEKSSEWDKFCMSFFGETNAGKSTIIEALRIVYDEEKRREELEEQNAIFKTEMFRERDEYSELLETINQLNGHLATKKKKKILSFLKMFGFMLFGMLIGFVVAYVLLRL